MANEFLVSVADVIGRDSTTGNLLFIGKANISSAFNMTTQKTDVRGGINNPLLYTYYHDREVSVKIESATFDKTVLALNAGTTVSNDTVTVAKKEAITLVAGVGTCTETPIGNVGVLLPNGTIQNVTPSGAEITVSGGAAQEVDVVYNYSETLVDEVVGYTNLPPTGIHLTMISEIRNSSNTKTYDFIVDIPAFNISGNYNLSLSANGVSNQAIEGTALVTVAASGDYYYKSWWVPSAATSVAYSDIAATPSTIMFDVSDLPDTSQITVYGIRGGIYQNVNVTTSCSFVRTSGCTTFTVSAAGLVTATSAVLADSAAVISATYYDATAGSLVDTMNLAATA